MHSHKEEQKGREREAGQCGVNVQLSGSYLGNRKKILHGLRRVKGQVGGIERMVEEDRYCVDVLNQIAAARMALARLAIIVLEDHTRGCVAEALHKEEREEELIGELMEIIRKFM